jgi:hypothetical protein
VSESAWGATAAVLGTSLLVYPDVQPGVPWETEGTSRSGVNLPYEYGNAIRLTCGRGPLQIYMPDFGLQPSSSLPPRETILDLIQRRLAQLSASFTQPVLP